MFIWCGNAESGRVRVLDTDDMVTEEVDLIQLKSLQAKGYTIKKDFSYDYAYEFINLLKNHMFINYKSVFAGMSDVDMDYILGKIIDYNKEFKLGIDCQSMFSYTHAYWFVLQDVGAFGLFANTNQVGVLLVNEFGIHQSSMQLVDEFPDIVPLFDFGIVENGDIVVRLRFFSIYHYKQDVTRYFHIDRLGVVREEHSDMYNLFN